MSERVLQALAVASELTGTNWSEAAAEAVHRKLAVHDERAVLYAIDQAMSHAKGRLTLGAIMTHLPDPHGFLGVEEAWAAVPKDEHSTAIICDEMMQAWVAVKDTYSFDKVGARMAFKETYERLVVESKAAGRKAKFRVSLGHDVQAREDVVRQALERGIITEERAQHMLPHLPSRERGGEPCELVEHRTGQLVQLRELTGTLTKRP
jgi:hypothetical protein